LSKGERSWTYNTGGAGRIPPVVDGNNVCAAFSDGTISLIDSTLGKPAWEKKLDAQISASPAITSDRIIAGTNEETVFCLDNYSGKTIWRTYVPYYVNSPPTVSGKFVFLGTWGGEIVSLETNTGTKRWSQPTNAEIKTSPSVSTNSVYVGSWDSNIYSYDYQTGTLQWQMSTSYNLNQCISLGSDQGYIPTKDQVVCIKLRGGVPLWTEKLDSQIVGELTINEDSIFALTNNGYLYRLNGRGTRVWTRKVDAPYTSRSISIIGDYVCLATGSILKFYDIATGKLKWQHDYGSTISQPVFAGGRLFITTDIGSLICLSHDNILIQSNQNWDLTNP
ncbi:MAG: PQQ-binding-like beta-propeller repeat protein, partial [Caldiserica bacterium]|nr:PQQ-binding-like beta-propeller repeat protein [Caldisericota bacterium]